jgi:hypothetical protein
MKWQAYYCQVCINAYGRLRMALPLLPYGVDHVAGDGVTISAQKAIMGRSFAPTGAPESVDEALAPPRYRTKPAQDAGIGVQISGFGKAANRPAATAQPSRWRTGRCETTPDQILRRFLGVAGSTMALRSRVACIAPDNSPARFRLGKVGSRNDNDRLSVDITRAWRLGVLERTYRVR